MILVATLIAAGIILLVIEVLLPGGVMGVIGGMLMLAGVVIAFVRFGLAIGGGAAAVAILALGAALYLEFRVLPRSRLLKAFSLSDPAGKSASTTLIEPSAVVGRECFSETRLAPTGYVRVGDQRFEAYCQDGAVAAGMMLRVVGVDNFKLIVTQSKHLS